MTELNLEQVSGSGDDPAPSGSSTMDRIRALYANEQGEQHLYLPIPRNPVMGVRYSAIDLDQFDSTATKMSDAQIDALIAAADTIVIRTGGPVSVDGKGWEPLTHDGVPVGFDETLGEILGVASQREGGSARQLVLKAFSRAPSPRAAIAVHFEKVADWMAGEGPVDEEELLGES